ncbi:hypothetical protein GOODEAATRI_028927 [Goodea atripinnis]|uniref:Uncharacterized protein n=1 Tax=Goodea atripinnis TaxID=208336 RepID=A0ABV0N581_9TELE
MESWIPKLLQLDTNIKLERAHKLPGPQTSRFSRAMMVRYYSFSDPQSVMDVARRLKDIRQDVARVAFFPVFAAATQKRQCEYDQARRKLQTVEGARYAMIYPASFRICIWH